MPIYCSFCRNNVLAPAEQVCPECALALKNLSRAWFAWGLINDRSSRCCGGLSSDKTHLFFHGKRWEVSEGDLTVEMGVQLFAEHAETYWILETEFSAQSLTYGRALPYPEGDDKETWEDWWKAVDRQLEDAALAAGDSDYRSCEECGYHYLGACCSGTL